MGPRPRPVISLRWVLFIASLLLVVAHVCVLPTGGHLGAAEAGTSHSHDPQEPHRGYGGSCDATAKEPTHDIVDASTPVSAPSVIATETTPLAGTDAYSIIVVLRPPRFLLHAALLI